MVDNYYNNIKNIMSGYGKMLSDTAPKARKSTQDIMKQIMTELNKLESSGKSIAKDISANYKTKMTPTKAKNIVKEAIGDVKANGANVATKSLPITKQAVQYLPFASSLYDIGRGGYQAFHGHPYAGTAQAGLGALGLLADMYTSGKGSSAIKPIINTVGKRLAPSMSKWTTRIGIPTVAELFYSDNKQQEEQPVDNASKYNNTSDSIEGFNINRELGNNIPVVRQTYTHTNNINTTGKSDGIADIILRNTNNGNGYNNSNNYQSNMLNNDNVNNVDTINNNNIYDEQQDKQQEQQKIDYSLALLNAIQSQEASNTSNYLKSLNMYKAALPFAQRSDYYTRLSNAYKAKALNNPYIANVGSIGNVDYITALPKISQEQASVLNNLLSSNVGRYANMQAASDAGLNPLTGLSDKSVLQQVGGIMKANTAADTKRYSTDRYFEGRQLAAQTQLQIQQMKNAIQEKLLDRTLSTKERMQLRDLQTKLSIAEQRNATNLELGRMGAISRPYTMGIGLTPEYGKLFGVNYNNNVSPDAGGIDPNVINSLINR